MKGGMKDRTGRYSFEFFLFLPVKTRKYLCIYVMLITFLPHTPAVSQTFSIFAKNVKTIKSKQ